MSTAIWWVRRDLRLIDNEALTSALTRAEQVIPAFIIDPMLMVSPYSSPKRWAFLLEGLQRLDADLRARGSYLVVRQGNPVKTLPELRTETDAHTIFAEKDFSPYARRRDDQVAAHLPLKLAGGLTVFPPGSVLKATGQPYTVFTPFSRAWKALPSPQAKDILPAPNRISTPPGLAGQPISSQPSLPLGVPFRPGEVEAQQRLAAFVLGQDPPVYRYAEARDRLDKMETSQLSPYLRFGMLSARQAVVTALRAIEAAPNATAQKGAETWLNELIWREFYVNILYHFPYVRRQSFRTNLRMIPWTNNEADFSAWRRGRTGYPVVDAAMRQLVETGWMPNRARMIVASFLVKDLLIDWRRGERWFMQHLIDGDPAANNGGWQWTAGTGTDAAPYFRIFSPILQGQKHDPLGTYVRRWVPQLAQVPDKFIHRPWEMPLDVQRRTDCIIGQDYPPPIIGHAWARERTLAAYDQARQL